VKVQPLEIGVDNLVDRGRSSPRPSLVLGELLAAEWVVVRGCSGGFGVAGDLVETHPAVAATKSRAARACGPVWHQRLFALGS
jgi:hypothetical protein